MIAINIGILSPDSETRDLLRSNVQRTGIAKVHVESEIYCNGRAHQSTRRFELANPDVIIVDLENFEPALQSLKTLSTILPKTWLFVVSSTDAPQSIIESMRAGAREFLGKNSLSQLSGALQRFLEERKRLEEGANPPGKIYCVTSAKGGAGATSVAINLASVLSTFPESRAGLIDFNMPMGDTATYLNLTPQFTLSDVLESLPRLDSTLLESFMTQVNRLSVLTGPTEFRQSSSLPVDAALRILDVASHMFTHVVVDGPQSQDQEKLRQITQISSLVLVVVTPEVPALWRTTRLLHFLESITGRDKLRLILNRFHKTNSISDKEIEQVLKFPLDWKLPDDYAAAIKAMNYGKPLVEVNHSALASGYNQLACHLTGVPVADKRKKRFALF